jgi:hypothetical protein
VNCCLTRAARRLQDLQLSLQTECLHRAESDCVLNQSALRIVMLLLEDELVIAYVEYVGSGRDTLAGQTAHVFVVHDPHHAILNLALARQQSAKQLPIEVSNKGGNRGAGAQPRRTESRRSGGAHLARAPYSHLLARKVVVRLWSERAVEPIDLGDCVGGP